MKNIFKSLCFGLLLAFTVISVNPIKDVNAATKTKVTYKLDKAYFGIDVMPFFITTFLIFLFSLKVIFFGISPFPETVSVPLQHLKIA